jgi:hypothetical protein
MSAAEPRDPTPVGRVARAVFTGGVCLTIGTGIGLYAIPGRTADYWAWTVKAPLSAAFFGAGYVGAAGVLSLAASAREWRRARIVAVLAFTLTSLALLETLRFLSQFAFHAGGLTEIVAWTWLAVYVALPPLVLAAFVVQERAGGAREYDVVSPPLAATRLVLGTAGAVVAARGVALPAAIVGAWFCTLASGLLWFAVRERDWSRGRFGIVPMAIPLVLDLAAAARLHQGFAGHAATAAYLVGVAVLLAAITGASLAEERRLRAATLRAAPSAA